MNPKSSLRSDPKISGINLLMPQWRCYKWLSPSCSRKMNITRIAYILVSLASMAISAIPAEARSYYVRETQGTVEIRGWEKGIIKKNPNLKRWHWMPITASYNHMKPVAPSKKPWKVQRVLRKAPVDRIVQNPHYVRMNHASLPTARNNDGSMRRNPRVSNPLVTHDVDGSIRARDVEAKLRMQRTNPQLAMRDVNAGLSVPVVRGQYRLAKHEVAGYLANKKTDIKLASHDLNGQLANHAVAGQLANRAVAGQLASRNVDGRLISQNVAGTIASKTVSADLITPIERRYEFDYRGPAGGFDDTLVFSSGYQSVKSGVAARLAKRNNRKF
jgi:hypothetical protein